MSALTVIVTACCSKEKLKYTLEGLVEQSIEDFDVLISDYGCDAEAKSLIREYCKEYVGFDFFESEVCLISQARNSAAKRAEGEWLIFIDGGDYISPETVESVLKTAEETKADIICPRYYISGENEPYYDRCADMLATVPSIDRLDSALLSTLDFDGRAYKKKFFDLYGLVFPDYPVFYNASFMLDCLFGCFAKATGAAGVVYDKRNGVFADGFTSYNEPSEENLNICINVYERAFSYIRSLIEEETGAFDGDEYSVQDILYLYFSALTDNFYRFFWYLPDTALEKLRNKFEEISQLMTDERRKKLNGAYKDLRFPQMYVTRADAAGMPLFSLFIDISGCPELNCFINSLYTQKFPFFELFIKKSAAESKYFPSRWSFCENITVLPDKNFFTEARSRAKGIPINIKNTEPLDPKLLSELSLTHAPASVIQYLFTGKRKKYSAKTYLKHKGLAIQ